MPRQQGTASLREYRAKRRFETTPEPAGDKRVRRRHHSAAGQPFFCVQKHLASHLHYDFRLEHAGVLLSWAVPKGPSLDPKQKRLALRVEDHPLEYGDFEGVIPQGYGAGIVMLWDRGTWEPETEDADAALAAGALKFRLHGYKLKGSWVLVRTGNRRGGAGMPSRSWLLIKHRDEWSGDVNVVAAAPRSIKTDRDFADILAADDPDIWQSDRPATGGEAGAMLREVIERAARIRARTRPPRPPRRRVTQRRPARGAKTAKAARRRRTGSRA
jgi:bifunctional non-homologous end joining protein LigD